MGQLATLIQKPMSQMSVPLEKCEQGQLYLSIGVYQAGVVCLVQGDHVIYLGDNRTAGRNGYDRVSAVKDKLTVRPLLPHETIEITQTKS